MVKPTLAECVVYSRHLRQAIIDYDLLPTEIRLLMLLCLETFDAGLIGDQVALQRWAEKLRMRDAKGLRVDKCEKVFKTLVDLGIVDLNATQATYQIRPDPLTWSRVRALYGPRKTESELQLCAERPLSESLSELSREKALGGVPEPDRDWHALFNGLQTALQAGPAEVERFQRDHPEMFSAEKSADVRRKNPPTESGDSAETLNAQCCQGFDVSRGDSAEKSADTAIASLAGTGTKAKLATAKTLSAEKSADMVAEAVAWVQSVDRLGQMEDPVYGPQWRRLCEEYPNYVLKRLKLRLETTEKSGKAEDRVDDPLAYLARKAREEGRMKR